MSTLSLASKISKIQPSPTLAITAKAKKMKSEGIDVVSFGAGEPDFNTPASICDAAIKAIQDGDTKYGPSAGSPKLREAIVAKLKRENGLECTPEQIVVSCGAKHSVYNALQVTVDQGDEVILLAPYWMTYAEQVVLAGGTPVVIHTTADADFAPTLDQLRDAISPRTKAIVINSPSNPTGAVLSRDVLKNIASLAIRHGFWIITDEIYERLVYGEKPQSIAGLGREVYDQTITINGCSKTYSMTGWRIGYAACPLPVAKAISTLQDQVTSNPTSFAQTGAVVAMNLPEAEVEAMRAEFEVRRDLILRLLRGIPGVTCSTPGGAFYAFADVSACLKPGETGLDLANALLEEAHVAVIPGSVFEGPGHIRLSYATSREEIERGLARIQQFLSARQ